VPFSAFMRKYTPPERVLMAYITARRARVSVRAGGA
jgi:hypothetical protein